MRVQSVGKNNYNCQTNQNSKNHPAFKASILLKVGRIMPGDMPDADFVLKKSGFGEAFKRLLKENGIELPKNLLGNAILYVRSLDNKTGVLMAIDKDAKHAKQALSEFPTDFEAKIGESEEHLRTILNTATEASETEKYQTSLEILDFYKGNNCTLRLHREI